VSASAALLDFLVSKERLAESGPGRWRLNFYDVTVRGRFHSESEKR
jgi:hypothetical protein